MQNDRMTEILKSWLVEFKKIKLNRIPITKKRGKKDGQTDISK